MAEELDHRVRLRFTTFEVEDETDCGWVKSQRKFLTSDLLLEQNKPRCDLEPFTQLVTFYCCIVRRANVIFEQSLSDIQRGGSSRDAGCVHHLGSALGSTGDLILSSKRKSTWTSLEKCLCCSYDYVELYDGKDTSHPKLGRYCGNHVSTFVSFGSQLAKHQPRNLLLFWCANANNATFETDKQAFSFFVAAAARIRVIRNVLVSSI